MTTRTTKLASLVAGVAAAGLLLSGCGGGAGTDSDANSDTSTGEGLPFGASKEEYQAAFADIEPIMLRTQTGGAEGAPQNLPREAYLDAITEWSDGKITFEIAYGNGVVPDATEVDNAVADGRLDFAFSIIGSYEPDIYPVTAALADATFVGNAGSLGSMTVTGWANEIGYLHPEFAEEWANEGVKMITWAEPVMGSQLTPLVCAQPAPQTLEQAAGVIVSASGEAKVAMAEALGMSPISMPWNEQYEAFERGVIGCALTSISAMDAGGLHPVSPYALLDSEVSLSFPNAAYGFNMDVWEGLPLVAQQLIFDRLDVLLSESVLHGIDGVKVGIDKLVANGGGVVEFEADAREAAGAANEGLLESIAARNVPGVDVAEFQAASDRWRAILTDDLGYDNVPVGEFVADYSRGDVDSEEYAQVLFEEVFLEHRPE